MRGVKSGKCSISVFGYYCPKKKHVSEHKSVFCLFTDATCGWGLRHQWVTWTQEGNSKHAGVTADLDPRRFGAPPTKHSFFPIYSNCKLLGDVL